MLEVSFSISPVDLVSRSRSLPARSTKDTLPCRVCPKLGSCGKGSCNHENIPIAAFLRVLQPLAARQVHERDFAVLCVPEIRVLQQISNISFSVDPLLPPEQCAPWASEGLLSTCTAMMECKVTVSDFGGK